MGFLGPFKCPFCSSGDSLQHGFLECKVAVPVWQFLALRFGFVFPNGACLDFFLSLWHGRGMGAPIWGLIPAAVCWAIWKARNAWLFDGVHPRPETLISATIFHLQQFTMVSPVVVSVQGWQTFSPFTFLHLQRRHPIPLAVCWTRPHGCWKLNVDGSSLGNPGPSGGGIVLRDSGGSVILAESFFFGFGTSLFAESMALLRGLELCASRGFTGLVVETDSKSLSSFLTTGHSWPWSIFSILFNARHLLRSVAATFQHIYREANTVADYLAKHAASSQVSNSFAPASLPRQLQGLVRLDQLGCPSIRLRFSKCL